MRSVLAPCMALCLTAAWPAAAEQEGGKSPEGAKVWVGRYAEYEDYLRNAPIDRLEEVGEGVTKPLRGFFSPGGLARSVVVKPLPPKRQKGYWESYKSEIAAYELDRILGLDMVPVTVERRVNGQGASAQLWVSGCKLLRVLGTDVKPDQPVKWAKEVCRQRVFDCLIANIDRNAGNILVDDQWDLILIDHSRAFAANARPFEKEITRLDREMFERLKALDEATLMERLKPWIFGKGTVRELLKRRDKIVERLESQARERGEAAVFPF